MPALFARAVLRLFGWRVQAARLGTATDVPITCKKRRRPNCDEPSGEEPKKETLFRGVVGATIGRLLRLAGGRPVDRDHARGAVAQLAQLMATEEWCWLGLSPEGTRRYTTHIRSGFYYLALQLDLPVGLAYFDYRTRVVGVTDFVRMSGSVDRDLALLRAYYADKVGRHPQQQSDICFARESAPVNGS